jgi:hypothetical protein
MGNGFEKGLEEFDCQASNHAFDGRIMKPMHRWAAFKKRGFLFAITFYIANRLAMSRISPCLENPRSLPGRPESDLFIWPL